MEGPQGRAVRISTNGEAKDGANSGKRSTPFVLKLDNFLRSRRAQKTRRGEAER
jgi:hypothetical protein